MCELDSLGNVQAVNTWGCNGLLARSTPIGGVFTSVLYAFDGYGNTSQRLDASGNVLETLLASAWGTLQSSNPNIGYYTNCVSEFPVGYGKPHPYQPERLMRR